MIKFKKFSILEDIKVTDYAAEGKSIARIDNYVVFIENAIPGDVLDIKLQKIIRLYKKQLKILTSTKRKKKKKKKKIMPLES